MTGQTHKRYINWLLLLSAFVLLGAFAALTGHTLLHHHDIERTTSCDICQAFTSWAPAAAIFYAALIPGVIAARPHDYVQRLSRVQYAASFNLRAPPQ